MFHFHALDICTLKMMAIYKRGLSPPAFFYFLYCMRRSASLTLFLALLSVVSGYLLSNASWIGRMGISLFYREYTFLKTWWKAALLVFAVLILLFAIQTLLQRTMKAGVAKAIHVFAIAAAAVGLYLTYDDFRSSLSHRWMGERFHLGAYLFWVGWMVISMYLLLTKKNDKAMNRRVGPDM
jgi:hypothetical protein